MKKFLFALLAFCSLALACPAYSHHDYYWASDYTAPTRPPDTLLDNCHSLGIDRAVCDAASDLNLSVEQRKNLILDALITENEYPGFIETGNWNDGLSFGRYPPDGTTSVSSGNIRDAWIKIASISPSVFDSEKNETWINDTGKIKNEFSFSFVVQKRTFPGDCQTIYQICGYDYSLQTFQNGGLMGTGKNVNFEAMGAHNQTNDFESVLSVASEYQIDHYELVAHCSEESCWTSCDFSHTDAVKSNLRLSDRKTTYRYNFTSSAKSLVESYDRGLADLWLRTISNENFNKYEFRLGNSLFATDGMQYSLNYDLPPYNVLTPKTTKSPARNQFYGLAVLELENISPYGEKAHLLIPATDLNCSLKIFSHFRADEYSEFCNLTDQISILSLTIVNRTDDWFTVKIEFRDNSTSLPLADKGIVMNYGNQTATVITDANGSATVSFNYSGTASTLTAEFKTDLETKSAKTRLVIPSKPLNLGTKFVIALIIVLVAWLFYRLVKRSIP
jgi:hypothetical protein